MSQERFDQFLDATARAQKARAESFQAQSQGQPEPAADAPKVVCSLSVLSDGSSALYVPEGPSRRRAVALLMHHLADVLEQLEEQEAT